jgi:hypothetical protein
MSEPISTWLPVAAGRPLLPGDVLDLTGFERFASPVYWLLLDVLPAGPNASPRCVLVPFDQDQSERPLEPWIDIDAREGHYIAAAGFALRTRLTITISAEALSANGCRIAGHLGRSALNDVQDSLRHMATALHAANQTVDAIPAEELDRLDVVSSLSPARRRRTEIHCARIQAAAKTLLPSASMASVADLHLICGRITTTHVAIKKPTPTARLAADGEKKRQAAIVAEFQIGQGTARIYCAPNTDRQVLSLTGVEVTAVFCDERPASAFSDRTYTEPDELAPASHRLWRIYGPDGLTVIEAESS